MAIINLPLTSSLDHLWNLQGKSNFLCHFLPNYVELAKGFTCLLKKGIPFIWDEIAQNYFDALKNNLISAPLLQTPELSPQLLLLLGCS